MKRLQVVGFIRRPVAAAGLAASVLCLASISGVVAGVDSVAQAKEEADSRTGVLEKNVDPLVAEGEKLSSDGKFQEAKAKYLEALNQLSGLGSSSYVVSKTERVKSLLSRNSIKWGNSEMERARAKYVSALTVQDDKKATSAYNEAISIAKGAAQINPGLHDSSEAFISDCNKMLEAKGFKAATSLEAIDPQNAQRKEEIAVLLKQSQILYETKQYSKVRDNVEKILVKDPYNDEAIRLLAKSYRKLYQVADARRENEILERMAEVEWKWNQAILPTDNIVPKGQSPSEKKNSKSGLYDKLQRLVFDAIEFEDANISSVISYLSSRSKEIDPDKIGVNLVLQMTPEESAKVPKVNMSFERIPMTEAIRYLCQSCGLKYRVEDKAVLIGTKDIDDMDIRFFQVRAALISSLSNGASDTEEAAAKEKEGDAKDVTKAFGGGGVKETFTGPTATKIAVTATSEALMKYFSERGVPFDEGSAIAYDKRAGKLIVKNTPENLRKLESLIRDLDIQTPLVLIESKIMEISQTDIEELGFDWALSQRPDTAADVGNHLTAGQANYQYYYDGNSYTDTTSNILRSYGSNDSKNTSATTGYKMVNNMKVLPNVISGYDVNLTVNAIQQNARSEVLSTPKVIATSGTTAVIRMVQEMYFPQSWSEPDTSIGNNTFEYTPSYPEFGDPTDVGIRFEVTPTVSPNNYTISLHLNPQVVALTGWTDYSYPVTISNSQNTTSSTNLNALIKMPEISRRDLNTNIKVYDGETVVLGGMLRDSSYQRDDKWPGLGEIPLVGRFFGSQMHMSDKKNLLIFVTSRLMSGDGVPVRTNPANGMFEFNR